MAVYAHYSATQCPILVVMDRLGDKWAMLILKSLRENGGPMRFNHLRRDIEGVSQKVLSQSLKGLERDGLVSRVVLQTVPVSVEYAMTPLMNSLKVPLDALSDWADEHIGEVLDARWRFDVAREDDQTTNRLTG